MATDSIHRSFAKRNRHEDDLQSYCFIHHVRFSVLELHWQRLRAVSRSQGGLGSRHGAGPERHWRVVACGGDGMRDASVLRESGISENAAQDIATRLKTAEARLTEDQRRRFDSFSKTIPMDAEHGQHSPVHKRGS